MGSDMYMEAQNFRPRMSYAVWEDDELVIYKDSPITGFHESWRSPANINVNDPIILSLLKIMVKDIPPKPVPFKTKLLSILDAHYDDRISEDEAVTRIRDLFATPEMMVSFDG